MPLDIFLIVAIVLIFLWTVFNPFIGLVAFTILLYIRPANFFPMLEPMHLTRILAIFTFILMLFQRTKDRIRVSSRCVQSKLMFILMFIMICSILTSIWRVNTIGQLIGFIKIYVGVILILNMCDSPRRLRILFDVMVFSGLFLGLLAIIQYFGEEVVLYQDRMYVNFSGLFKDPNDFAQQMIMLIPFAYFGLFLKNNNIFKKGLFLISIFVFLVAIVLTGSRGAFLGLVGLAIFTALKAKRKGLAIFACIILFAACFQFAPAEYKDRMMQISTAMTNDESTIGRLDAWRAGFSMMKTRLFGVGLGNFGEGFVTYRRFDALAPLGARKAAHNAFIQIGGETGIFGFILFILLILTTFVSLQQQKKLFLEKEEDFDEISEITKYIDAIFLSLVTYGITAFFLSQAYNWIFYYLIAFSIVVTKFHEYLDREKANLKKPYEKD